MQNYPMTTSRLSSFYRLLFPLFLIGLLAHICAADVQLIGRGQAVDISKHLASGNITIVDFYADWCGPCKMIAPTLDKLVKSDSGIALRKIDIVDWTSPVARQHHVQVLPFVQIYDRKGRLVGTVAGVDPKRIEQYVAQAKSSS